MVLPMVRMHLSTSALACGHRGVILLCLHPICSMNSAKSCPLNGGPLSVLIWSGIPKIANILSRWGITVEAAVERMTSATGSLEYSSRMTIICSLPTGMDRQKPHWSHSRVCLAVATSVVVRTSVEACWLDRVSTGLLVFQPLCLSLRTTPFSSEAASFWLLLGVPRGRWLVPDPVVLRESPVWFLGVSGSCQSWHIVQCLHASAIPGFRGQLFLLCRLQLSTGQSGWQTLQAAAQGRLRWQTWFHPE